MYKKILIATDGSELATKAIAYGLAQAKESGAEVKFVTATEMWSAFDIGGQVAAGTPDPVADFEKAAAEIADKILEKAKAAAKEAGVSCEAVHIKDQHPAEAIIETANNSGTDLIVLGSHGRRGIQKMILGSISSEVLVKSKVPVLVIR